MKKKVAGISIITMVLGSTVFLAACGSSMSDMGATNEMAMESPSGGNYHSYATDDIYAGENTYDTPDMEEVFDEDVAAYDDVETQEEKAVVDLEPEKTVESNRKLIKNVELDVETKEFDALIQNIEDKVKALGGYLENSSVQGNSYNSYSRRNATYKARIPSNKMDQFVDAVAEASNVTNKSEDAQDVTLQYVDMESRKKTLKIEQERITKLLEQADSVKVIVELESRLTEIRYQLESIESQIRTYDNLVDYATVTIYVSEVEILTPVVEQTQTTGEKMADGFNDSLSRIGNGFRDFFVWFVVNIPYFMIWAIVILIIIFVIRYFIKRKNKKTGKKKEVTETVWQQNKQEETLEDKKEE